MTHRGDIGVRVNFAMEGTPLPRFGARHRVVLLGFFGFFNVYAMRVNLSVAAIKMSDQYQWYVSESVAVRGVPC